MRKFFFFFLFFSLFLSSCGEPSWVLSEKKMEDVLFDIHIADGEIRMNYADFHKEEEKADLYESIYEKHGITKHDFDTSLVWYGANLDKFVRIYENLQKRYSVISDTLEACLERERIKNIIPVDPNQINIWEGINSCMLSSSGFKNNLFSFNIDTVFFSTKEDYKLTFNVLGISDTITVPTVTLGINFKDSTYILRKKIISNGYHSLSIPYSDSTSVPQRIFGKIYVPVDSRPHPISIYNIELYKKKQDNIPIQR